MHHTSEIFTSRVNTFTSRLLFGETCISHTKMCANAKKREIKKERKMEKMEMTNETERTRDLI